jgi:hypothetical protein
MQDSVACEEASDCAAGDVCCLVSDAISIAIGCESGTCTTGVQVCRSITECVTGTCAVWVCEGVMVEACSDPLPAGPGTCTKM